MRIIVDKWWARDTWSCRVYYKYAAPDRKKHEWKFKSFSVSFSVCDVFCFFTTRELYLKATCWISSKGERNFDSSLFLCVSNKHTRFSVRYYSRKVTFLFLIFVLSEENSNRWKWIDCSWSFDSDIISWNLL